MVYIRFVQSPNKLLLLMLALLTSGDVLLAQSDDGPPHELQSPDHRYSVRMVETALPGASQYTGDFTIEVLQGEKSVSKFPTIGYLEAAYWSPDGKYVAVNNRRGNCGDYLWVFNLSDGHAIKKPVDAAGDIPEDVYEQFDRKMVRHISPLYPKQTYENYRKDFTFATGWTDQNELAVTNDVQFNNLEDRVIEVFETYVVKRSKLRLLHRELKTRARGKNEF